MFYVLHQYIYLLHYICKHIFTHTYIHIFEEDLWESNCNSSVGTWAGQIYNFRIPIPQSYTSYWSKQEAVPFTIFNSTHPHQLFNKNQQNHFKKILPRILRLTATMMIEYTGKKVPSEELFLGTNGRIVTCSQSTKGRRDSRTPEPRPVHAYKS